MAYRKHKKKKLAGKVSVQPPEGSPAPAFIGTPEEMEIMRKYKQGVQRYWDAYSLRQDELARIAAEKGLGRTDVQVQQDFIVQASDSLRKFGLQPSYDETAVALLYKK